MQLEMKSDSQLDICSATIAVKAFINFTYLSLSIFCFPAEGEEAK